MHRRFLKERDAFPESAGEYTQQPIERLPLLEEARKGLDAAWGKLEEGWAVHNERMVRLGLSPRTVDESVVELNVGGSNVSVCWCLLAEAVGFKESPLGALLEGVWGKGRIPRDADGRIVLDESPACVKHIMHMMLRDNELVSAPGAVGMLGSASSFATALDEAPCLTYTAHVMELSRYVPTHPQYAKMNGGSAILKPFEIAPFSARIREVVGCSTGEMTLIYRATRDGFGSESFTARCGKDSPNTVSLIRVSAGQANDEDSVIGGYSSQAWAEPAGNTSGWSAEGKTPSFVFTVRYGRSYGTTHRQNTNWSTNNCAYQGPRKVLPVNGTGPTFGEGDLATIFDETSGRCTIQVGKHVANSYAYSYHHSVKSCNGKNVVEIEVYRYSTPAAPTTAAPITTKPVGEALTGVAEAREINSFGKSIATSLMEERVVLERAVKELKAAGARVSDAVGALETVFGPSVAAGGQDTVVDLNVRGTRMTTLRSTLQACPRSALAAMYDPEKRLVSGTKLDRHGELIFDYSPCIFSKILDVLRMRKRASWARDAAGRKLEGGGSDGLPIGVLIKETDWPYFYQAVRELFAGDPSFITDLVQRV